MDNYLEQSIYESQREDGTFDWDYFQYLCDVRSDEPEEYNDDWEREYDYLIED